MRRFIGIIKLYNAQTLGQFHGLQGRLGLGMIVILYFSMGCGLAPIVKSFFFHGGTFNVAGGAQILIFGFLSVLSLMLLLCPYVFFERSQVDEMVTLTQYPISSSWMAVCKLYDLGISMAQLSIVPLIPIYIKLWQRGSKTGNLQALIFYVLLLQCVMLASIFIGYCWTILVLWGAKYIPTRHIRFGFVLVAWCLFSVAVVASLTLLLRGSSEFSASLFASCESMLEPYLFGGLFYSSVVILIFYAFLWILFRFSLWVIRYLYINRIYWLKNHLTRASHEGSRKSGGRIVLPFIPRPFQAMCVKELQLTLRSIEFWLLISISVVSVSIAMISTIPMAMFSGIVENPSEFFSGDISSNRHIIAIFIGFAAFFSQCGLWSFKYEERECENLIFYPVYGTSVVLGKAFAYFLVLLPLLSITIISQYDREIGFYSIFQVSYILCFVYFVCVNCVVVSGMTINHNAQNLLLAVRAIGRLTFFGVMSIEIILFFLFLIIAILMPSLFILGTLFLIFASYLLASKSHFLIKGLSGGRKIHTKPEKGEFGRFTFIRSAQYFLECHKTPFWLGMLATLPVLTVLIYALSGLAGFSGLSTFAKTAVLLWVPLIAFLCFWQKIQSGVRIFSFIALLLGLPIFLVVNSPEFHRYFAKYHPRLSNIFITHPVRINNICNKHIWKEFRDTRSNSIEKKTKVPKVICKKFGYPTNITIDELFLEPPPPPARFAEFIRELKHHYDFFYIIRYKQKRPFFEWVQTSGATTKSLTSIGKIIFSELGSTSYAYSGFYEDLFRFLASEMNEKDRFEVYESLIKEINTITDEHERLLNCLKPDEMSDAKQKKLCSILLKKFDWSDDEENVSTAKGLASCYFEFKDCFPEQGIPFPDLSPTVCHQNAIAVLKEFTIPEAFDKIDELCVTTLQDKYSHLFPSSEWRIEGKSEPSMKLLAKIADEYPIYSAYLWCYNPFLKTNSKFLEFYSKRLETPRDSRLFLKMLRKRDIGGEQVAFLKDDKLLRKVISDMGSNRREKTAKPDNLKDERISLLRDVLRNSIENDPGIIKLAFSNEILVENHFPNSIVYQLNSSLINTDLLYNFPENTKNNITQNSEKYLRALRNGVMLLAEKNPKEGGMFSYELDYLIDLMPKKESESLRRAISVAGFPILSFLGRFKSKTAIKKSDLPEFKKLLELWGTKNRKNIVSGSYFLEHIYNNLSKIADKNLRIRWLEAFKNHSESGELLADVLKNSISSEHELFDRCGKLERYNTMRSYAISEYFSRHNSPETAYLLSDGYYRSLNLESKKPSMTKVILSLFGIPLALTACFWLSVMTFCVFPAYRSRTEEKRERRWRPTITQAVALLFGLAFLQVSMTFIIWQISDFDTPGVGILGIVNLCSVALAIWIGLSWFKIDFKTACPLKSFNGKIILGVILATVGFQVICSEMDNLLQSVLPMSEMLRNLFMGLTKSGISTWLVVGIIAPVTEELLFRGLLLRGFIKNYGIPKAIIATALLFALFHLNIYQFFGAFAMGIFLGWLTQVTKSLWPAIISHAFFNMTCLVATMFISPGDLVPSSIHFQPWWLNLLGIAALFFGILLIKKTIPEHSRE